MTWTTRPCEVHGPHNPRPVENAVVLVAGREVVMCPTGHRNFQLAVTYMTGKYTGDAPMNRIGVATWDLAQAEVSHREYAIMNAETLG